MYKAVKENDGTYSIRYSQCGLNYNEIVKLGVRGCNVAKTIGKLYWRDLHMHTNFQEKSARLTNLQKRNV